MAVKPRQGFPIGAERGAPRMTPATTAETAQILRDTQTPLHITGGGTRSIGPCNGAPLSTAALQGITHYDPGALTVIARAGTPVAVLESTLAENNQMLPFEPILPGAILGRNGQSTIGGVAAANASGARRIAAGACRDLALGLTFVDGLGRVHRAGGKVMKNVTGYDTTRLLVGSHGTLGIITEVAFKVLPRAELTLTLIANGLSDGAAIAAMSAAFSTPYEVTGAMHFSRGQTILRLEGFGETLPKRASTLQAILGADFSEISDCYDWAALRRFGWLDPRDGTTFWRISVRPSDGAATAATLRAAGAVNVSFDWGGGLIWAQMPTGVDIRRHLPGLQGHATRMDDAAHAFHPENAGAAALGAALRKQFDPQGRFNQGKMG